MKKLATGIPDNYYENLDIGGFPIVDTTKDKGATISVTEGEDANTLAFNIEVPSDVSEPIKETVTEKAKRFIKNTFNESPESATDDTRQTQGTGRGRPKGTKKASGFAFQTQAGMISIGIITLLGSWGPQHWSDVYKVNDEMFSLLPTVPQMEAMVLPLLRIADRHTHVDKVNPDTADVLLCVAAMVAYGFDLQAHSLMIQSIQKAEEDAKRKANNAYGDSFSTGPTI